MKPILRALPEGAKCLRCRGQATIRTPSHHANFCEACFVHYARTAVQRAMKKSGYTPATPLLVAVSGGKDSLALWDLLHELGYQTRGLHIGLDIAGFSEASLAAIQRFAEPRGLPWAAYSLKETIGYSIEEIRKRTRRKVCSICGTLKRQFLNRLTIREDYGVLATGHNLDDEAGRLLGNFVRHRHRYNEKLYPFLASPDPRIPAKLKPLYRLESYELRTYCRIRGIEPVEGKCPLSRGATSHAFKEALDFLEERMPGTKRDFLFTFLDRKGPPPIGSDFITCQRCGEPAFGEVCSVCNLLEQVKQKEAQEASPEA